MDFSRIALLLLFLVMMMRSDVVGDEGGLSFDFYHQSCPQVEDIVRRGLQSICLADPTAPAAVLRLMFHDCQVQGCDASILLDPENDTVQSEMASTKNFGIKRASIGIIKSMVELACPQQVSCADILILAAREAVALAGGPRIKVPLGRRDSFGPPSFKLADASLPPANIGIDGMLTLFASKGMTVEESIAIVGAHTLGITHCLSLRNRSSYIAGIEMKSIIKLSCHLPLGSASDSISFVVNDPTTLVFDNCYFVNAMNGFGILRIDAEMPLDPRTAPFVQSFAGDQDNFFQAFSSAFVKLSSSSVLTGSQGTVRRICNAIT
ncbi:hypothetical protein ACH5RR_031004 [Cinchona calisaya]|uniref:Peroxidase n=1 Tax=Cinchona calisaya TaxID=153742 RepID=A0ABD2YIC4_9GENT